VQQLADDIETALAADPALARGVQTHAGRIVAPGLATGV
jgi:alanine dehydrogenase